MCAARMGQMGIRALVIEKSARVGDVWRARRVSELIPRITNLIVAIQVPELVTPYFRSPLRK
jgi:cation diffusion facilitator CzcD-associated flavoprotein CzcO